MKSIIIFKEKHGDRYFDASTPELVEAACKKVLLQRYNDGYWYDPGTKPECEWDGFDISVLPEKYQNNAKREYEQYLKYKKSYEADVRFLAKVKEIAETPNYVPDKDSKWAFHGLGEFLSLLSRRKYAQYENFWVEDIEKVD